MAPGTRSSKESRSASRNSSATADETKRGKPAASDSKAASAAESKDASTTQPLGPPPRPQQNGEQGDYFNQVHSTNGNPSYQTEPNPFDAQFSNPSGDTPGKLLPPVASLTSPSALLPNDTPGWNNSLRSGPLSPAMLAGPASSTDYFSDSFRAGLITPNESGLRTGLTPGGTGSMFPAASPSGTSMFGSLALATPNTLDFIRTGVNAKNVVNGLGPTSQPSDSQASQSVELQLPAQTSSDSFAHPDADAANGLFLLAQSNGSRNQFAVQPQNSAPASSAPLEESTSPSQDQADGQKDSGSATVLGESSESEQSEPAKPATRSRGRRNTEAKSGNKRKAGENATKTPNNKRQRAQPVQEREESSPIQESSSASKDNRKMTDEEKRKNFLERNRVAALKCRQRKKQWLQNLQTKVDLFSQENDVLTTTVNQLREEVLNMRQLLMQHKDCSVTASAGFTPQAFLAYINPPDSRGNPLTYMQPAAGVNQSMQMMVPDGRQAPTSQSQGTPRMLPSL